MAPSHSELRRRLQQAVGEHYTLEREIARGGMGVVFLATDRTLDRPVAIKVVPPELAGQAAVAQRFLAEARTVARMRHPNIVAVHTAGHVDGLLYYVMDYVEGESLRQRLTREGAIAAGDARRILQDVAAALDSAALAGVVHRDVKPANVLLDGATGRALLADFGIARIAGADGGAEITGDGLVLGTPTYMSPEQAAGEEIDARSDIYALGVLTYEMLAGKPPFEGPHRLVVSRHISTRPEPIARACPDCPANLAHAVMRALEKAPGDRWQRAREMGTAAGAQVPPRAGRRRVAVAALAAAVLLVLGIVGILFPWGGGIPDGVNPRQSMLVLPFANLRQDPGLDWLTDGSLSMMALNLSQWEDLQVTDQGRVHDLLGGHTRAGGGPIRLEEARRLAREAGAWTVLLGEFDRAGDTLQLTARVYDVATGRRIDRATARGAPGEDVRPLFDELAAELLDLSGAPAEVTTGIARATTTSLEAYRAYLAGVDHLNRWELGPAIADLDRATAMDSTFGLAYYYLAVARGWIYGAMDPVSERAITLAARYSDPLPLQQRTLILAYRSFIQGDMETSRRYYQQILERSPADAAAWYGLGEAWYHDESRPEAERWTNSLRAFKRTRELDPGFSLAYDHVKEMLHNAARAYPYMALMEADSFVQARSGSGRLLLDSAALAQAVQRARAASLSLARTWVTNQPTGLRARNALIDAFVNDGQYRSALAEADQIAADSGSHPEMPFVRSRIFFAAGDQERAGATLREALDSVTPRDFASLDPSYNLVRSVEATANVFAYQGDLANAALSIEFADQVRTALELRPVTHTTDVDPLEWQRWRLSHLYAASGVSVANQRRVWESAAEAARRVDPEQRKKVARTGAAAALGIFMETNDTTALTELRALSGDEFSPEVRAWMAIGRNDPDGARTILSRQETDSAKSVWDQSWNRFYRKPMEAEVYYAMGDYYKTLALLEEFEPDRFLTDWFDVRWGMLGRVRMLRALAYEQLGQKEEAQSQYRQVIAQWQSADESVEPLRQRAEQALARLAGEAG